MLDNLKNLSYLERLKKLKLPSLKFRRTRGDLIQAFKIINKLDNIDRDNFFTLNNYSVTRNSQNKLYKPLATSRLRASFFSLRVINHWNSLSHAARNAKDLLTFKKLIDIELKKIMYTYDE